ncbi:MAG: hypothetical protein WCT06_07235, partial [Armatimonadota bacterium]
MKKIFLSAFLLLLAVSFCCAANLVPNGDLENQSGPKPYMRKFMKDGNDSPLIKTSFITEDGGNRAMLMESQSVDGVTEINYQSITGMESGKMYYVWFKLKPISIGENARASCRITLYNADGKFIKHYFSPASPIKDIEVQDFLYPFDVPAETAKAQLTLWLSGIQKTVVDNVSIDSMLPSLGNTDGNLIF